MGGVRRANGTRQPIMRHLRDLVDLRLGEARIGRHNADHGVLRDCLRRGARQEAKHIQHISKAAFG